MSQPIHVGDCGCFVIGGSTYRVMCGWLAPGYGVTLINRPNRVMAGDDPEQRNAAHDAGLKIAADLVSDASELPRTKDGAVYLDTLNIRIDVAEALKRARTAGARYRVGRDSVAAFMVGQGDTATARRIRQTIGQFEHEQERMVPRLLQATLDCIVDTASLSPLPVRHVRVTIVGDPVLAKLGGTCAVPRRSIPPGREY